MAHYYHVDDSGDPGFSGSLSSSSYFALAMVKLAERAPLPEIKTLRQTLNLDSGFEFKYHTTKLRQKDFFFEMIQSLSFQIRAVVVKKQLLGGNLTQLNGQDFTTHFLAQLILRASDMEIANDILIIDSATSASIRALRLKLSEECRKANRVRPFKKIVGGDSQRRVNSWHTTIMLTIRAIRVSADRRSGFQRIVVIFFLLRVSNREVK
ncbi:MAG: hypothetical protein HZB77_07415 [Chloroflexi bacterium]|nr:hypothetical protein [Chloroflexota bacterium]